MLLLCYACFWFHFCSPLRSPCGASVAPFALVVTDGFDSDGASAKTLRKDTGSEFVDVPDDASQVDDDTTQLKHQHAYNSRVSPPALSEEGPQRDDVDRRQEGRKPGKHSSRPPARTSTPVYSVDGSIDDDDGDTSGVAPRVPASERRTPLLSMDGSLDGSMSMPEDDLLTYSSSMIGGSASFTATGGSGAGGDKENAFATFAASMREASELAAAPSTLKKKHSRDRISIVEAKQHGSPSLGLRESSPTVVGSIPVKGTQGSRRQKHSRSIPRSPKVPGQKMASNLLLDDFDGEDSEVDFEVESSMFLSKSDFYMSEEDDLSTAAER
jgi:hypothetical protein